jgi:hypothetical protein
MHEPSTHDSRLNKLARRVVSAPQTGERVRYVPLAQLRPAFAGGRRILN